MRYFLLAGVLLSASCSAEEVASSFAWTQKIEPVASEGLKLKLTEQIDTQIADKVIADKVKK